MHADGPTDPWPIELRRKIAWALGVSLEQVDEISPQVTLEELCDTVLMALEPGHDDRYPTDLIAPVVKTVNARLGPHRLAGLGRRRPLRIVLGASAHFPPGWIATEFAFLDLLNPDHWRRFFASGSIDAMLAEHVWEHLTEEEGARAAALCLVYLRPGGHLRVAVPDGCHPDDAYREHVRPGGSGAGADDHKVLFTHRSLQAMFDQVGFDTRLLEYFDESGTFHGKDWDTRDGFVHRSRRFDPRNQEGTLRYTSIILDAVKPGGAPVA